MQRLDPGRGQRVIRFIPQIAGPPPLFEDGRSRAAAGIEHCIRPGLAAIVVYLDQLAVLYPFFPGIVWVEKNLGLVVLQFEENGVVGMGGMDPVERVLGYKAKPIFLPGRRVDLVLGLGIGLFVDGQLFALFEEQVLVLVKFDPAAAEKLGSRLDRCGITRRWERNSVLDLLIEGDLPITRSRRMKTNRVPSSAYLK